MLNRLFRAVFGSRNQRVLKALGKNVRAIRALEAEMRGLSDEALGAKTEAFKARLAQGATLDDLLVEAFAVVCEASERALGMRHYDVQLLGGMVLHQGKIAEMGTGEGKTLVSTLPVYLNALTGRGVHVVTVNDYLAQRDADWMRPVYTLLGMDVGVVTSDMPVEAKRAAYAADVVYATNNALGFDYLRDNMVTHLSQSVQRPLAFAIVDEVDSILIDEARTPLIISGPVSETLDLYPAIHRWVQTLKVEADFTVDEKERQVHLTEAGHAALETTLHQAGALGAQESLYDVQHLGLLHHVQAALRAIHCYQRDVDYMVVDQNVVIVDEHTGRTMPGRRWSDGLHQAVEAKEGVTVQQENQTLASITFQNFFRLYDKLAGMTGTADTEAYEFNDIYGLEVVVVPTHRPIARQDLADRVFLTQDEKFKAVLDDLKARHETGQPVLVGTASIESSEHMSRLLKKEGIPHEVLNAKQHAREASIVAQAGKWKAVTIATNMAGRGTDIVLGGNPAKAVDDAADPEAAEAIRVAWQTEQDRVKAVGGLYVLGTERHESRRIDNQFRGRSGRQGDPGASRFYLALEDPLMRIFASDRVSAMMSRLGMGDGGALESPMLTRAIETAQRKVEGHHYDVRKQLLSYDNVVNEQRQLVYRLRRDLLTSEDLSDVLEGMMAPVAEHIVSQHIPEEGGWDWDGLQQATQAFGLDLVWSDRGLQRAEVVTRLTSALHEGYALRQRLWGDEVRAELERSLLIQVLDWQWKDHLQALDRLRQGIHLRGFAQKNPIQEFKREAFALFDHFLSQVKHASILHMLTCEVGPAEPASEDATATEQTLPLENRPGRNDPCPCGSGEKYKRCHGALT